MNLGQKSRVKGILGGQNVGVVLSNEPKFLFQIDFIFPVAKRVHDGPRETRHALEIGTGAPKNGRRLAEDFEQLAYSDWPQLREHIQSDQRFGVSHGSVSQV